ncbi:MAG TPA: potassium channel family protein [Candidatus Acidoferrum sp.]|nr:potassium channel family protein [Candidatus Acidoferrum sp.]
MVGPIFAIVGGILLSVGILWEAFETIVLPRRATRRFRFTRLFYRSTWRPWRAIAGRMPRSKSRETFLSYFGPLSLLFLFVFWGVGIIVAFGLLYYGSGGHGTIVSSERSARDFIESLYFSGTTFFTLGLGDVTPHGWPQRLLAVVESGLGFGFLALVFSYLPVIYQAFSRREVNIVLLDSRAGSPPTAFELIRRHSGPQGWSELQQLFREWERASADILESHVSYPVVAYFRSQHNNESWVAALAAILDTSALLIAGISGFHQPPSEQRTATMPEQGGTGNGQKQTDAKVAKMACARQARLTFAMCRHTVVDLAQVFNATPRSRTERLPAAELDRLRSALASEGFVLRDTPEMHEKLSKLRAMYEPYLEGLGEFLEMDVPPWILGGEAIENWRTSAWGRISGFSPSRESVSAGDDHD